MDYTDEISEVLLRIITEGVLRIRYCSHDASRCFMEADHIHNLPHLVQNFSWPLFDFYWYVERPSYLERSFNSTQAFEPLWEKLRFLAEERNSDPAE